MLSSKYGNNKTSDIKLVYLYSTIIYLLQVSATHVAILGEVLYQGWAYRDITKVCELMHRCKILHFSRSWSKFVTKVAKACRRQVYKILLHIYVHLLVSLPLYYTCIYQYRTIKIIPTYLNSYTYMQRSYLLKNATPFHVLPRDS